MPETPRANIREYTVSELSGAVKRAIEDEFGFVRVRGELGRVTRPGSGHLYLDLKDENAVIAAVMWKGVAQRLSVTPEQGLEVIATGRMTTFAGQSKYQLIIDSLEPAGVGALMALFEERKKKLAAEGLFDAARKRPLPFLPDVIGVVTSPSGAVIRDILHRLRDRFPRHVIVWPALVQGRGAEEQIVRAIRGFNALTAGGAVARPDVIIVARGGGSLEDLWCFNEESVVRAAAESQIPLISAVGHETDTTLIDFAADRRAPTPTAAAEMVTPVRTDLIAETLMRERRLLNATTRIFEAARADLRAAGRGLGRPEDLLVTRAQRLDSAGHRLGAGLSQRLAAAEARLIRVTPRLGPRAFSALTAHKAAALARAAQRLARAGDAQIGAAARRVARLRLPMAAVRSLARERALSLQRLAERQRRTVGETLPRLALRLAASGQLLRTLSHHSVLERGFALVTLGDGALMRGAGAAPAGAPVTLRFADGARPATLGPQSPDAATRHPAPPADARGQAPGPRGDALPRGRQGRLFED